MAALGFKTSSNSTVHSVKAIQPYMELFHFGVGEVGSQALGTRGLIG